MKIKQLKRMLDNFDDELEIVSSFNNLIDKVPLRFLCLYKHEPAFKYKDDYVVLVIEDEFINTEKELNYLNKNTIYNTYDDFLIFTDDGKYKWYKFNKNGKLIKK